MAAIKALYCHPDYNPRLFEVLERHLLGNKKRTGRPGMDLWCIFVLSQVRLCLNMSYDWIHNLSNNHIGIRWLMRIETEHGFKRTEFSYQNIYDNVSLFHQRLVLWLSHTGWGNSCSVMVGKIFQHLVDVRFIPVSFYDGRF